MTDIEKRTITIQRTFDAPISLVWGAWTQSEHIANWWGPPGMKMDIVKHDFVVGGDWEYIMRMPDGNPFKSFGTYSRIDAPNIIETSANFIPMTEGVTLVAEFKSAGDKTAFTFKVIHPTEAYAKEQEKMGIYNGWGSVFERLNNYVLNKSE